MNHKKTNTSAAVNICLVTAALTLSAMFYYTSLFIHISVFWSATVSVNDSVSDISFVLNNKSPRGLTWFDLRLTIIRVSYHPQSNQSARDHRGWSPAWTWQETQTPHYINITSYYASPLPHIVQQCSQNIPCTWPHLEPESAQQWSWGGASIAAPKLWWEPTCFFFSDCTSTAVYFFS